MQKLSGRTAFISGGASGIGLAMARAFLDEGMNVAIGDIDTDALAKASKELGNGVLALEMDVMDRDAYAAAADETEAKFGNVHLVCNNAGVLGGGLKDADPNEWEWILGVNVLGVVNGVLTFMHRIKAHGEGGHIVNTASIAGVLPGDSVYNVSKSATFAYSEGLQRTLADDGIGVSVLCPGLVDTNLFHAERNRPPRFARDASWPPPAFTEDQRAGFVARRRDTMTTVEFCADRVIEGVKNDQLYIFTHPDLKAPVEARFNRILEAMDGLPEPPLPG